MFSTFAFPAACGVELRKTGVVHAPVEVAVQLVAADMIQRLLGRAVFVDLPREEVVDAVSLQVRAGQRRSVRLLRGSGKDLDALIEPRGVRRFVGVVERAVRCLQPSRRCRPAGRAAGDPSA